METKPLPADADPLSRKIEAFTGAASKAVWIRYTGTGGDVFANYDKLQLWGIDTRDGKGARAILADEGNYSRPLILPDGSGIVFSDKRTSRKPSGKKAFKPVIFRVDWNGKNLKEIGKGYAAEVWRDPKTGTDWIYSSDLLPTDRSSVEGSKLERFPLNHPEKREPVWDRTKVGTENMQLSLDGARASCLFPWPECGVINLEKGTHKKYQHGCWPSMAPDDSYHAWVFDGAHKNLLMFTDGAKENWSVAVNTAPGVGKHEVYHPRWSNHVRFMTMTGPYSGKTVSRSDSTEVEVYVGKFSPDLKKVDDWLQITDDKSGDMFPDLWVAGGDLASSGTAVASVATATETPDEWPVGAGPYLFVWENRDAVNSIDTAGTRESSVEAKGNARFGPHFEMLTGGGHFEMDEASATAVNACLSGAGDQPFTVELVARPDLGNPDGDVFWSKGLTVSYLLAEWIFSTTGGTADTNPIQPIGAIESKKPSHLAVVFDGKTFQGYVDGKPSTKPVEKGDFGGASIVTTPLFGHDWSGAIEGVAISAKAASPEMIAASAAYWEKKIAARKPIPTVRLRGKLVEMTGDRPVEALDTYQRALLGYLYEVEEVLEGEFDGKQVAVMHWTILDRQPLSGFPREIGKSYELILQPTAAHPELISERQWNDLLDPSEPWFDIAHPR